jgi:hypothetical protein
MTREDIEKAALKGVEEYVNSGNLKGFRGSYCKGFMEGAKWRINSVWHDANEMPDLGEAIIVELFGKVWDYGTYDVSDAIHPKAKWAYMNDLIPSKED